MIRDEIYALARRRGFFYPANEIYGGVAGFYDYGPLGVRLKENIIRLWRKYYVLNEGFMEIESPTIGPEDVFIASGHVDEFVDHMLVCKNCGAEYKAEEAGEACQKCGGEFGRPLPFNLMFATNIGVKNARKAYLRPETAQAMFVSFSALYLYNREKMPFGVVQVGKGYRNEISPRQGLIRLREFTMAEAEVFVEPWNKKWPRFSQIREDKLMLIDRNNKEWKITAEQAVKRGIIGSEALAYFIAMTRRFLVEVGVDDGRLRFRQHKPAEQAHYAMECWDAEAYTSYGWVELVGIADRGDYDLSRHIECSGADLKAFRRFEEPKVVEKTIIRPKMRYLGRKYGKKAARIAEELKKSAQVLVCKGSEQGEGIHVAVDGQTIFVEKEGYEIVKIKESIGGERYVPHVVEPSYGIDRILYTVLEHAYTKVSGRRVMRLRPQVAPISVGVFPLMAKNGLEEMAKSVDEMLRSEGIITYYDDAGSIGRRYARMDEVGTPYCVTVDYESLQKNDVTIRERDTTKQVRVKVEALTEIINDLVMERKRFEDLEGKK